MEGEFVEDQIATETASGAWICGEDFDAAGLAVDGDASFEVHGLEAAIGGEVSLFEGVASKTRDVGAFAVEFDAVGFGIGKDGDEASGVGDEAINSPRCKGEGFSGLAGPQPDVNAVGAVEKGSELVGTKVD